MRTLGETRLWYAIFTPLIGAAAHLAFRQRWLLNYALGMGALFLVVNLLRPEAHNRALMPALQSVWFVPHVLVYIFAYALFAASSAIAVRGLWRMGRARAVRDGALSAPVVGEDAAHLGLAGRLVYPGLGFLTLGLLFGALWAKEAWGHYWTWDPKETWALITWLGYLAFIHIRHWLPAATKAALWVLALSFVILLICWFGVNYLPSAAQSVHTYTQ
ncbi:cytochrome c biogenesis protein CcsA [Termitidicoccus mucosus]